MNCAVFPRDSSDSPEPASFPPMAFEALGGRKRLKAARAKVVSVGIRLEIRRKKHMGFFLQGDETIKTIPISKCHGSNRLAVTVPPSTVMR